MLPETIPTTVEGAVAYAETLHDHLVSLADAFADLEPALGHTIASQRASEAARKVGLAILALRPLRSR